MTLFFRSNFLWAILLLFLIPTLTTPQNAKRDARLTARLKNSSVWSVMPPMNPSLVIPPATIAPIAVAKSPIAAVKLSQRLLNQRTLLHSPLLLRNHYPPLARSEEHTSELQSQ